MGLISSIVHDVGHDGKNNNFHVNAHTELALTYNDKSVLENYHVAVAFRLLAVCPNTNILAGLPREQYALVRREIIDMVLSTDMNVHFAKVGTFSEHVAKLGDYPSEWAPDETAMFALRSMILHCADISNQGKSAGIAYQWSMRILKEFFIQGEIEKQLALPVSPLCDRKTIDIPASQVGFIDFIVRPSFDLLARIAPPVKDIAHVELARNKDEWKRSEMTYIEVESWRSHEFTSACESIPLMPLLFDRSHEREGHQVAAEGGVAFPESELTKHKVM